jgi:hypothetical protein
MTNAYVIRNILKERDYFGDLGVDGIKLKLILEKYGVNG